MVWVYRESLRLVAFVFGLGIVWASIRTARKAWGHWRPWLKRPRQAFSSWRRQSFPQLQVDCRVHYVGRCNIWRIKTIEIYKFVGIVNYVNPYLCKYSRDRSVMPVLTCCGNFDALVFGYINGASVSTRSLSSGKVPLSKSLRTPVSDLSLQR